MPKTSDTVTCHALLPVAKAWTVVDEESDLYLRSLKNSALSQEVQSRLDSVNASVRRNPEERRRLLAAIQEMGQRLPHGSYERYIKWLGLNPATVRKWSSRQHTDYEIEELVGGYRPKRKPKKKLKESAAQELAHLGKKFVDAYRKKDWERCNEIAEQYEEMYAPATEEFYADDWEPA